MCPALCGRQISPDRFRNRAEAIGMQECGELGIDLRDQSRSVIDERRIKLHGMGAGSDFGIGVGAAGNAAAADKIERAAKLAGDLFQHACGFLEQWRTR